MKKVLDFVKSRPMEAALLSLLSVQVLLIVCSNFCLIGQNLDGDSAKLLNHIRMMWKEKALAIPGWFYSTTLEWDCTALFALPVYGLTGNIYVACAVSNTIFLALFLAVLFFVFDGKSMFYPLLCANLICIPYRIGMLDYYNMLFFAGTQYIVKILIPLLLVGLLLFLERGGESRRRTGVFWFFSGVFLLFLLVSSMSSGVYVTACGLIPVWSVCLGYHFFNWKKIPAGEIFLACACVLCVLIGLFVNSALMSGTRAESMVLCGVYHMLVNTSSCFFGLFELLGGLTGNENIAIFSLQGISTLSKFLLVILLLICGLAALVRCVKKQGDLRMVFLLAIPLWNYFILNAAYVKAGSASYEYRYHLMGMIPLMCVAVTVALDAFFERNAGQQRVLFVFAAAALLFLNGVSFRELLTGGPQHQEMRELDEYMRTQGVRTVYMYDEILDPDICRLLDDEILYLAISLDGEVWAYDYYGEYAPGELETENVIVVVKNEEYDMGDSFSVAGHQLVMTDEIANRKLYRFDE